MDEKETGELIVLDPVTTIFKWLNADERNGLRVCYRCYRNPKYVQPLDPHTAKLRVMALGVAQLKMTGRLS